MDVIRCLCFSVWLISLSMTISVLSFSVLSDSLWPHGLLALRLLCPWDSPGENTGVGCHAFLQGIFPTQGSNLGLPHYRWILYQLSHQRSQSLVPSILCKWHYFVLFNGWVIFHFIYVLHLLCPFLWQWTFRLLPCLGYCKQHSNEYLGTCILLDQVFPCICA